MSWQPQVEHPHLDALRTAFTKHQLRCPSGVIEVNAADLILYYSKSESDSSACRLDFTCASDDDLKKLADTCDHATFGRDQENVHDESYRSAGVLKTTQFAIGFDPVSSGVINAIADSLLEGYDRSKVYLHHELYKLNIYGPGQFFKAHKDTPRAQNMIASLVVVLPPVHEGGALELQQGDHSTTFDSASLLSDAYQESIAFAAFFGDVIHEVAPVTAGYRVTLTYNLFVNNTDSDPVVSPAISDAQHTAIQAALTTAMEDADYLPEGGYIGFVLRHEYPLYMSDEDATKAIKPFLKGSDAVLSKISESLGLETSIWVAYKDDPSHNTVILCEARADMPILEVEFGEEWRILRDECGGKRVRETYNSRYSILVHWATNTRRAPIPFQEGFVAYGNEASLSFLYGHLCLLVRLGPSGNRRSPPIALDSESDDSDEVPEDPWD